MEVDSNDESAGTTAKTLTPADRIADLNQIDESIAHLLSAASEATLVLSNTQTKSRSLTDAEEAFRSASADYFSTLSSIEVRLRRQVYALEEAGLITAGTERDARRGRTVTAETDDSASSNLRATAGGALDPSWLNARVSDSVELRKRMELLEEGKKMVKELQQQKVSKEDDDDQMDQGEG